MSNAIAKGKSNRQRQQMLECFPAGKIVFQNSSSIIATTTAAATAAADLGMLIEPYLFFHPKVFE